MSVEDKIRKRQVELAAVYRREMEVLHARLGGHWEKVASLSDEDLAREIGLPSAPSVGSELPSWLDGPLRAAQDAATEMRILNYVLFVLVVEEEA